MSSLLRQTASKRPMAMTMRTKKVLSGRKIASKRPESDSVAGSACRRATSSANGRLGLGAGGAVEPRVGGEAVALLVHLLGRLEHGVDGAVACELGQADAALSRLAQVRQR